MTVHTEHTTGTHPLAHPLAAASPPLTIVIFAVVFIVS